MPGLWEVLRYEEAIALTLEALRADAGSALLAGPPGVGKSYVAKGIGAFWQERGGAAILVEGDGMRSDSALYPFRFAISELSSGWSDYAPGASTIARFAESFGPTQGVVTEAIENIANARKGRRLKQTEFLGDEQQSVFFELERLGKKRPILLVADNLHWWDEQSLLFLDNLMDDRIRSSFPFLGGLRVLGVRTLDSYQPASHPELLEALLARHLGRGHTLGRVSREGFAATLEALGAVPPPTEKLAAQVFDLTGGHLALASQAARRIAEGDSDALAGAARSDEFIRSILTDRFSSLGSLTSQVEDLLAVAAVLGLVFRREEILCGVDGDPRSTAQLLRRCRDENLLEVDDHSVHFVHDLYRQYFLDTSGSDRVAIHERLIDCLRDIRAADYALRSANAVEAEEITLAGTLAALEALRQLREGATTYQLPPEVDAALGESGHRATVEQIREAIALLNDARYRECREALDRLPRALPRLLSAEADFIRATCDMSTRSESDRARARALLASWSDLPTEERELGTRLARLRIYGLTHLIDKTEARLLDQDVRRVLAERAAVDAWAEDAIYSMDRCSGRLLLPDFALVQYQEAAKHFAPADDQSIVRRPLEYFKALANVLAALVGNGRFEDALSARSTLQRFVDAHPGVSFPRPDSVLANALIAEFRIGAIDANAAVARQREIIDFAGRDGDAFYLRNALAVYQALDNDLDNSRQELIELDGLLRSRGPDPETSSIYMIRANLCGVRLALGDTDGLAAEWNALEQVAEEIAYVVRSMYVKRHQLMRPLFTSGNPISTTEFDKYPIESSPSEFGPLWASYGRGFILPEVEYWRED